MSNPTRPHKIKTRPQNRPSKHEILEYISKSTKPAGRRQIERAFNLGRPDREWLSNILRNIHTNHGVTTDKGVRPLPPVGVANVIKIDTDGLAWVAPTSGDGNLPALPLRGLKNEQLTISLGRGDRILARFVIEISGDEAFSVPHARLIRKLPNKIQRIIGIVTGQPNGPFQIEGVSKRDRTTNALDTANHDVRPGDLVTAEVEDHGKEHRMSVVKVHGSSSDPGQTCLISIHEHGLRHEFAADVLEEAENSLIPSHDMRSDLQHIAFITIDPVDARDHDDAVAAMPDLSSSNDGGWIVSVAIADVAHFVRTGSALDREARLRGNSVYFPDQVLPMLPEILSSDLCSLKPDIPRPVLAAHMVFNAAGKIISHRFERGMIRSRANITYEEAQEAIDGRGSNRTQPFLDSALRPLWLAYECVAKGRDLRGPLSLNLPERHIKFDANGLPCGISTPTRLEAHRMIEEFMIAANVAAAETLERKGFNFLRRIHDVPAPEKLDSLRVYLRCLDLNLTRGGQVTTTQFNALLAESRHKEQEEAVAQAILRSQSQAIYAPVDKGHFGLNLRRYTHFTSPIRRYADIVTHRALISAFSFGEDGYCRDDAAGLEELGRQLSTAERTAMAAERDTKDRLIAEYLSNKIGAEFAGRITGIIKAGLFVELDETGASGFVAASVLGRKYDDYFQSDESTFSLLGRRSGLGFRIGEPAMIQLQDANSLRGTLEFELLTPPHPIEGIRRDKAGHRANTKRIRSPSRRGPSGRART
jgi:ribonuclease R